MHKQKKGITVLAVIAAALLIGACLYRMPKFFGKGVDPKQVHHIHVFDGQTGEGFAIDDPARIRYIVENIRSIPMRRDGISLGCMGYGLQISYIDENDRDVVPVFFVNSDDTIRKDPFFYHCDGGLGFDDLKELEAEIVGGSIATDCRAFAPICIDGVTYYDTGLRLPMEPEESEIEYAQIPLDADGPSVSAWARLEGEMLAVRIGDAWYEYSADWLGNDEGHDEIDQDLSIGIIGGADGPTFIYVTGFVNWPKVITLLGGLVVLVALGIVLVRKKRSPK